MRVRAHAMRGLSIKRLVRAQLHSGLQNQISHFRSRSQVLFPDKNSCYIITNQGIALETFDMDNHKVVECKLALSVCS